MRSLGLRLRCHRRDLYQHSLAQGPRKRCDINLANAGVADGVLLNLLSAFLSRGQSRFPVGARGLNRDWGVDCD